MVFSAPIFLFVFLPVFFALYWICPERHRNTLALAGSYTFYAWGAPKFALVLLASSAVDYLLGRAIAGAESRDRRRAALIASLLLNLGTLAYFKYANFAVEEIGELLALMGLGAPHWVDVALPIGISFFTFQKLSYILDVYTRRKPPADRFVDYALYVALFPQLIAGPIIRFHDVADQLRRRDHTLEKTGEGVFLFCRGLAKKVLIADELGAVADAVFGLDPGAVPTPYAWIGLLAYSFQIYFDFSGYSDMALGLGRMLGFVFPENFRMPYIARNVTEFWRRWHISLGNWMREYLYIPLGGNRISARRTYLNLWTVFLFSGLWHGAAWNFVLWGAFHGLFLSLDRLFWIRWSRRIPRALNAVLTFGVVSLGWVLFRSETLSQALVYTARLFDFSDSVSLPLRLLWGDLLSHRALFVFGVATLLSFGPLLLPEAVLRRNLRSEGARVAALVLALALFWLSILAVTGSTFHPFIYFRF